MRRVTWIKNISSVTEKYFYDICLTILNINVSAYNLADAGFDVWMGNARGVINSRNHVSLNPDNPKDAQKFFDYSFEDIATKDLPTMIDYVLQRTKQDKLHYVGHSQGGTAFLVLNSLLPKYNDKFISADILAGVGYQDHFPTDIVKSIAKATDFLYVSKVCLMWS